MSLQGTVRARKSLAPCPSHLEVKIAIAKLKNYISPGSVQIPEDMI
jgi:hypothetical protein